MMDDRILLGYAGVALAATGHGDLDAAIGTTLDLPAGTPGRGSLAVALLTAVTRDPRLDMHRLRWVDRLVAAADADPPPSPSWPSLRAAAIALGIMVAAVEGRVHDPRAALSEIETLAAEAGPGSPAATLLESSRQALGFMTAMHEGDESTIQALPEQLARLREQAEASAPQTVPTADTLVALGEFMAANQAGRDLDGPLRQLHAAAERLPADDPMRAMLMDELARMSPLVGGGPEVLGGTVGADDLQDPAVRLVQEGMVLLDRWEETEPAKIEQAIGKVREAVARTGPADPQRPLHLAGLALTIVRRSEVTNSIAGLAEARTLLGEARDLAGGPHHPQWAWINQIYSAVEQRLGAPETTRYDAAMDALRGYSYQVMVQPSLAGATVAAREAAREAASAARWALQAADPAGAVTALDMGRGLALFAATEVGTIGRRLRAGGHAGLADRWDVAVASGEPGRLPTALRREALDALTRNDETALLDPPALDEIRNALRKLDADALVYLIPGPDDTPGVPGYAVVAPAAGPPSYLLLTDLLAGDHDVERYLSAAARRDIDDIEDEDEPGVDEAFAGRLDALCDWAWRAAIGPLVETYLPRLPAPPGDRPRRIVLVPIGDLGLIPWQAARRADGRYAVELVAISYAASARMLCHAANQTAVPLAPTGLVVGDPGTGGGIRSLPAARAEAYAIRRSFYAGARYVGRRADGGPSATGPGTRADVTDWLTNTGPGAGAMLHLACHGFMTTKGTPSAYVLLAGGERLTAEELGPLMARAPERRISLVVLAACHTGQAISGYDEAYSLGTAFLAAGVRSVLSTQWSVPDSDTSVLMYMFHHFLIARRRPAWAALRDAQLWMLDPDRSVPDRMPGELRHQLRKADPAAVASWAGFLHWGQ